MKKFTYLALSGLFLTACGGGGNVQSPVESSEISRTQPVKVNLIFPDDTPLTRGEDGTYKVVFLINGLNISVPPQSFDNLSPGHHTFTINVPVGGERFMSVLITKFDNGGVEYPLYYGDASFYMSENETVTVNVVMNRSFYTSGGRNYYPGTERYSLLGDLSTQTSDIGLESRYFANTEYTTSEEYSDNSKLPIKSYVVFRTLYSNNGTPLSGWSSQTVYQYMNTPSPSNIYKFYSFFFDSGIPAIFSPSSTNEVLTPFGLENGFSWGLFSNNNGNFKIVGLNYDFDSSRFEAQECEITYDEANGWSSPQNCQNIQNKSFTPSYTGGLSGKKPTGEIFLLYNPGEIDGESIFIPYPISLYAIPDTLTVPTNFKYLLEHFHTVHYPNDKVEQDVALKIDIPSSPEGTVTLATQTLSYTVPDSEYYVEICSAAEFKTPIDDQFLSENAFGLKLGIDKMVDFRKLSYTRIYSPRGKTVSTTANLEIPSGENTEKYALILTNGGNFHLIDISDTSSVNLQDISVDLSKDSSGKFVVVLSGNDKDSIYACNISFNVNDIEDSSPSDIASLFQPSTLQPYYVFKNLPPDRLFVKVPDLSHIKSALVECSNEDGSYKVFKLFHIGNQTETAFNYAQSFIKTETLIFDSSTPYITARYSSALDPDESIFVFSQIGDRYTESGYYIVEEDKLIETYRLLKGFLDRMENSNQTESLFAIYITNYKAGTYREGILSFRETENEETVILNSDGTVNLSWNTANFTQCSSNLTLLVSAEPAETPNDGQESVTAFANSTIYIYKICPNDAGADLYYKRFKVAEPAQANGTGSNGTVGMNTNIPNTSTPEAG